VIGWLKWQPGSELLLDGLRHESVLDAMIEAVRRRQVRLLYVDVSADTQRSRLRERDATSDIAGLMSDVTERDVQTKTSRARRLHRARRGSDRGNRRAGFDMDARQLLTQGSE